MPVRSSSRKEITDRISFIIAYGLDDLFCFEEPELKIAVKQIIFYCILLSSNYEFNIFFIFTYFAFVDSFVKIVRLTITY